MWTTIKNQLDSKIFSLEFGNMETLEYYPLCGSEPGSICH